MTPSPLDRLKYHVSGAIERGEKEPIIAQENTKMTHTPGPYEVTTEMFGLQGMRVTGIVAANNYPVANLGTGDVGKKNAQYIVHCVNTHDALVEALQIIATWEPTASPDEPHGMSIM